MYLPARVGFISMSQTESPDLNTFDKIVVNLQLRPSFMKNRDKGYKLKVFGYPITGHKPAWNARLVSKV